MSGGRAPLAVAASLATLAGLAASAQDDAVVIRRLEAVGHGGERIDLGAVERLQSEVATRVREALRPSLSTTAPRLVPREHKSGLPACRMAARRTEVLTSPLPPAFRGATFYFVRLSRGGTRPSILPAKIQQGHAVLALDAPDTADVAALAGEIGSPVSMAGASFAKALGVVCTNAAVEVAGDGTTLTIREEIP